MEKYIGLYIGVKVTPFSSPGFELPLFAENFAPLNDFFQFPSILDTDDQVFNLHLTNILLMLSSHLYFGLPCDRLVCKGYSNFIAGLGRR
jgi:hypothetical protein